MTRRFLRIALPVTATALMVACEQAVEPTVQGPDDDFQSVATAPTSLDMIGTNPSAEYPVYYAVGDLAITVNLPVPGGDVGVAFDGTRIFYNNFSTNLHSFEPADPLGTVVTVAVTDGLGTPLNLDAMAYDGTRDVIWAVVHGTDDIYMIDKSTGDATFQFSAAGKCDRCVGSFRDGLAFDAGAPGDPSDDAIWWSRDVDFEVYKLDLTGATLESFFLDDVDENIEISSGIAVGGPNLYLANNGLDEIFRVDKAAKTLVDLFAAPDRRPEDLACDPVSQAVEVMWVRQLEAPNELVAFEIEPGTCGIGGQPSGPMEVEIDIKPGSFPNSFSLADRGRLPVAVLTTEEFDAADVDPTTVTLGDDDGDDTPVASRRNGTLFASLEDVDGDGDLDLILHFEVQALQANGDLDASTTELILNGETTGGEAFKVSDSVNLVGGP